MSRNAIIGVAVALCVVAAGVGGFLAARSPKAQLSAPEPGVSVDAGVQPVSSSQVPLPAGTDAVVAETQRAPEVPPASVAPPASAEPAPPATARPTVAPPARTSGGSARPAPARPSATGGLDRPWPSGSATPATPAPAPAGTIVAEPPAPVAPPIEQEQAPPAPPPPPEPQFDELVVARDAVLGLKLDTGVTSETAALEDKVEAHVTRDVRVGSRVAIPVGSRVLGSVTQVEQGGKMKTKARLGVRFHTIVLADGTRVPIRTDEIFREGDSPGQEAAGKVGAAAAGGAILGAILGGGRGAAVGGSIGAAGGAAAVMAGNRNPAVLQAGSAITVRLLQPVSIIVER